MANRPNDNERDDPSERRARSPQEMEKSEWVERGAPGAYDPVTEDERNAMGIVGSNTLRDGAIGGVSDPVPNSGVPIERGIGSAPGERKNPPLQAGAADPDGSLAMSGGVAGGTGEGGGQRTDTERVNARSTDDPRVNPDELQTPRPTDDPNFDTDELR